MGPMLSFDVEEFFQVEAAAHVIDPQSWDSMPKRLEPVVSRILQLLDEYQSSATFFILGWVARYERRLVRRIADMGHEIASHGMSHRMLNRLNPAEFRQELHDSRRLLEDISGQVVSGFRAPTFSINHTTAWALDVLAETGFRYDSSVFPIRHDRYGVPDAPVGPHYAVGPGGGKILEIPPLTVRVFGKNLPLGGGGYLRLFPVRAIDFALKKALSRAQRPMLYLHPWELDADQPVLPIRLWARWRHGVGLGRTEKKLAWLLKRYKMVSVGQVEQELAAKAESHYCYGLPAS